MLITTSKRARVESNPVSTIVDSRCVSVVSGIIVLRIWFGERGGGGGGPGVWHGGYESSHGGQDNGEDELTKTTISRNVSVDYWDLPKL